MDQIDLDIQARAEKILEYQFKDAILLQRALVHASVADDHLASNERLEFLGDAVLGFVICEFLFGKYPQHNEGELTKIKSAVVSRRVCAHISDDIGLTDLLKLGKGMTGHAGLPASIAAAVFESIVAAIYLDGGMEMARDFILKHMSDIAEQAEASAHQQNFKSVLQQHAQRHLIEMPTYLLLDEKGPDHSKCFEVCVEISSKRFPSAWGQSKKQAEQQAALLALQALEVIEIAENGEAYFLESDPVDPNSR